MKKKNILILGSEGQIGAHLVDFFKQKKNYNISKFDLVLGKAHDLRETSNKNLERKIKSSDFIFFLAFDVGGSRYLKKYQNTYDFVSNNIKTSCHCSVSVTSFLCSNSNCISCIS